MDTEYDFCLNKKQIAKIKNIHEQIFKENHLFTQYSEEIGSHIQKSSKIRSWISFPYICISLCAYTSKSLRKTMDDINTEGVRRFTSTFFDGIMEQILICVE